MEANLNDVERLVRPVLNRAPATGRRLVVGAICRAVGEELDRLDEGPEILPASFCTTFQYLSRRLRTARWGWMWRPGRCSGHCSRRLLKWPNWLPTKSIRPYPTSIRSSICNSTRVRRPGSRAGNHHDRRRRATELGQASRTLLRDHQLPPRHSLAGATFPVRRAALSRTRPLGWIVRLHVLGGRELGEIRFAPGGGPLRRGLRRRYGRSSPTHEGRFRTIGCRIAFGSAGEDRVLSVKF